MIHKERLIFHAPWFASRLEGKFKIEDEAFTVAHSEPEIFRMFEHWIYFQNIDLKVDQSSLVRLHLLARSLEVLGLQKDTMSRIIQLATTNDGRELPCSPELINLAWEAAAASADLPLIALLVDITAFQTGSVFLLENAAAYPAKFNALVMSAQAQRLSLRHKNEKAPFNTGVESYFGGKVPLELSDDESETLVAPPSKRRRTRGRHTYM